MRYHWIEKIKILAVFAIIVIHSTSQLVEGLEPQEINWWVGNVFNASSRWAVPVFIMITGCLLIPSYNKESDFLLFFKKRLSRIIIPVFFWTLFYQLISIYQGHIWDSLFFFKSIYLGSPYYHLWYLYMLLGLYFLTPILASFCKIASNKDIYYLTLISLFIMSLYGIFDFYWREGQLNIFLDWFPYYPYFLLGHFFVATEQGKRNKASIFIFLFGISLLSIIILTYFLYPIYGIMTFKLTYEGLNPLVILMSASLFLLFYKSSFMAEKPNSFFKKIVRQIANYSLGIYVIHPFIMLSVGKAFGLYTSIYQNTTWILTIFLVLLYSLSIYALSLGACYFISKLPYGQKLVT